MTTATRRRDGSAKPPGSVLLVLYFAVVTAPLAFAVASGIPPDSPWGEAATAAGSVALAAIVVQFLTSGRFKVFAGRAGIDVTMAFHKWVARLILLAIVLHPLLYAAPTFFADWHRGVARLAGMVSAPRLTTGVVAWLAVVGLAALAVSRNHLPLKYESWRATHFLLAVIAVGGGIDHALRAGIYSAEPALRRYWWAAAIVAAASVLLLYGWRWKRLYTRPWRLESLRRAGTAIWELSFVAEPGTPPLAFRAGQFVWMSAAPCRFPLFEHPFSIASATGEPTLRLIVKELGDFTEKIGGLEPGTRIGFDGPHGHFTLDGHDADAVLLVAGGVGIAPVMGLLRELVGRRDKRPVRLVYGAGSPDKIAFRDEIETAGDEIDLRPILVSETVSSDWRGTIGVLDPPILEQALEGLDRRRVLAMVCGPNPMVTAVVGTLEELGLAPGRIAYERFDYHPRSATRRERWHLRLFSGLASVIVLAAVAFALR